MREFTPPISERSTQKLIAMVHYGQYQPEAVSQAKAELMRRNVSLSEQEKYVDEEFQKAKKFIIEEGRKFKANESESYEKWEIIGIFIFGPFLLFNRQLFNLSDLLSLHSENYKLKFKQRLVTLVLSSLVYAISIIWYINWKDEQQQKEIDKIDITTWKKKYNY